MDNELTTPSKAIIAAAERISSEWDLDNGAREPQAPFIAEIIEEELRAERASIQKAQALVDRLQVIHNDPEYLSVWSSYQNHGGDYSNGPKYDKELGALKKVLAKI